MPGRALVLILALAAVARCANAAIEVPPGFVAERLASGLNAATALAALPDGRILIADQFGPLRVWKDGRVLDRPAIDLSARLDTYWERGLVGVTIHPEFPRQPYVYLMYVAKEPYTHHVISRFVMRGDTIDAATEQVLITGDDQRRYPGTHPHGHQGGPLVFGPDGRLYASIGEQTAGRPSQHLDTLIGKILRLNADGTIPPDNPFHGRTEGKYRAIYAIGLRNVFGLSFQPRSGRLFATDVGQTSWEEVDEIFAGANYGWPDVEGTGAKQGFVDPLHTYPPAIGRSIVGAAFPRIELMETLPSRWRGRFFFGDWAANWIKTMNPDAPHEVTNFARGLNGPVALVFTEKNALLVLERGTIWNDRSTFVANSGSLTRIRYSGELEGRVAKADFPAQLSGTGVFRETAKLEPAAGFEAFELNAPVWLPGITARRWLAVPASEFVRIDPAGPVRLPAGAMVVQHFATTEGVPVETHVYWFTDRRPRAAAYRWAKDGRDATLVPEAELIPVPGHPGRQWLSPAPERELNVDKAVGGFLLQLSVAQLNREIPTPTLPVYGGRPATGARINQLVLWNRRGWLEQPLAPSDIARLPRLASLDDRSASLELRVRSYLDANCAMCHRPGGPSRALFDARAHRPLAEAGMIEAVPITGDMGVAGARIVVPGAPEKSLLSLRLKDAGAFRMPPIRLSEELPPVVAELEEWIRSLAR